jgi:hypothetical protein
MMSKDRNIVLVVDDDPTHPELEGSWRRARELGLKFETASFERCYAFGM